MVWESAWHNTWGYDWGISRRLVGLERGCNYYNIIHLGDRKVVGILVVPFDGTGDDVEMALSGFFC